MDKMCMTVNEYLRESKFDKDGFRFAITWNRNGVLVWECGRIWNDTGIVGWGFTPEEAQQNYQEKWNAQVAIKESTNDQH